jgi:predicted metal-dependent hydrolase
MQKSVYVESIDKDIVISRRKGTRSIRISVKSDGKITLSVPYAVSERQALRFLHEKADWINKHHKPQLTLVDGMHIGKSNKIVLIKTNEDKIKTRLKTNQIIIYVPNNLDYLENEVQDAIRKACERALKKEAENLLPQRLNVIAKKNNIKFKSCSVKKLKSRWGSCDSYQNIVLNMYLIQLDWKLIDYVIYHELAHVKYKHHQKDFWNYMEQLLPDYKMLRKEIKLNATDIIPTSF